MNMANARAGLDWARVGDKWFRRGRHGAPRSSFLGAIAMFAVSFLPGTRVLLSRCLHRGQKMSSRRETEYRGYKIEMERRDLCWAVSVSPIRPELPILSRSSFPTITQ